MLRCACGNLFTLRNSPSIHCCANCYRNSRERPGRIRKRKVPAICGLHNHPRPDELLAELEATETTTGIVFVPGEDAKDGSDLA